MNYIKLLLKIECLFKGGEKEYNRFFPIDDLL